MKNTIWTLVFLGVFFLPITSYSQPRCECEYDGWVGDCTARVEKKGNWFKVISNTSQCSRVDWYVDGNPQVTIVTDGAEMEEWLWQKKNPSISIQSCKVCKDSMVSSTSRSQENSADSLIGKWEFSWNGALDSYTGYITIESKIGGDEYTGTVYSRGSQSSPLYQDARITISGSNVSIKCSNPTRREYEPDNFYLTKNGNYMKGYSVDNIGQRGRSIVFSKN